MKLEADDAVVSRLWDGQYRDEMTGSQFKTFAKEGIARVEALGDIDIFSGLVAEENDGSVRPSFNDALFGLLEACQ